MEGSHPAPALSGLRARIKGVACFRWRLAQKKTRFLKNPVRKQYETHIYPVLTHILPKTWFLGTRTEPVQNPYKSHTKPYGKYGFFWADGVPKKSATRTKPCSSAGAKIGFSIQNQFRVAADWQPVATSRQNNALSFESSCAADLLRLFLSP